MKEKTTPYNVEALLDAVDKKTLEEAAMPEKLEEIKNFYNQETLISIFGKPQSTTDINFLLDRIRVLEGRLSLSEDLRNQMYTNSKNLERALRTISRKCKHIGDGEYGAELCECSTRMTELALDAIRKNGE